MTAEDARINWFKACKKAFPQRPSKSQNHTNLYCYSLSVTVGKGFSRIVL
jgi:hypothetical protein